MEPCEMSELSVSNSRCQCSGCGEFFNSLASFDKHRVGTFGLDRRCRTGCEMLEAGMDKNTAGYWVTARSEGGFWGGKESDPDLDELI